MNTHQKILLSNIAKELPSFRQHGNRFYEEHHDFIKVVEVQFLNLPNDRKSFTIHFGIYVPILYKILWNQRIPKSIEASTCTFFCNINDILTEFKGKPKVKYWDLQNSDSLLTAISNIAKEHLYPFSQRVHSLEQLDDLLNTTQFPAKYVATYPILNATLKVVMGRESELKGLIKELNTRDSEYFIPQIRDMMQKAIEHGYKVSPSLLVQSLK